MKSAEIWFHDVLNGGFVRAVDQCRGLHWGVPLGSGFFLVFLSCKRWLGRREAEARSQRARTWEHRCYVRIEHNHNTSRSVARDVLVARPG